jgi:predicted AAA+ superfamily ATPase
MRIPRTTEIPIEQQAKVTLDYIRSNPNIVIYVDLQRFFQYFEKIFPIYHRFLSKSLRGPRQVGKTSILHQFRDHRLVLFDDLKVRSLAIEIQFFWTNYPVP